LHFYSRSFEEGTIGVDSFAQRWAGECAFAAPPASLVMRTIYKAAVTEMGGILLVPSWKGAKFLTWAFRDGRHLNGVFAANLQLIHMKALAWEISPKDRVGGSDLKFLVLGLNGVRCAGALESVSGKGRCFCRLFGKDCD
jgi:hypothetical protein